MKTLDNLRLKLHNNAELSGKEKETNKIINRFLEKTNPDIHIKNVGGYGIIAVFKGKEEGRNVMIRADIDALNIPEGERMCSHRCGHDGHAAILCGLAMKLSKKRPERGSVILLFQPAEETGEGAKAVIDDPLFRDIRPDTAFALHNLPGFAKHQIIVKKGCFAAASQGLKLLFEGKTSHASQPENAINPQIVIPILLDAFHRKYENLRNDRNHTTLTLTHASLGEKTFGVTPGHAEIWLTIRSYDNDSVNRLTDSTIELCRYIAQEYNLRFSHSIHEAFSATINTEREVEIVERAAMEMRLSVNKIKDPFPWSEDFGRFGDICPACLFGIGSGLEHEPLHSPHYDFEDEITETGVGVFERIVWESLE